MSYILTLVRPPSRPFQPQELMELGAHASQYSWLAPGRACDIACTEKKQIDLKTIPPGTDWALQPMGRRRKTLLLADMDSTIIVGETLDELAAEAGIKDQVSALTARAMNGEIDFSEALRIRVGMLRGLSANALERVANRIRFMPGAGSLVATMRQNGAYCALVSGGFSFFTSRVAATLNFHENVANNLVIRDGILTGAVTEPIVDKETKLRRLQILCRERNIDLSDSLTVGDGANDLPMLLAAGLGVAYRAKPSVAAAANFQVTHGDLTSLLYFQGYHEAEIVPGEKISLTK